MVEAICGIDVSSYEGCGQKATHEISMLKHSYPLGSIWKLPLNHPGLCGRYREPTKYWKLFCKTCIEKHGFVW